MGWRGLAWLATASILGACTSVLPQGPSVTVLPGPGKSLDQFQVEDVDCRGWATRQLGATAGENEWITQRRYDIAYVQCMYSRGNQIPGGPRGTPAPIPSPPEPPPPPQK